MAPEIDVRSDVTVNLIDHMGGDHMVVAAARVSSNGREALKWSDPEYADESRGLIRALMRQRHGCYDDQTEVLTDKGWKAWPDVDGSEGFVTLNREISTIEIQHATHVIHKPYAGPMLHFQMQQVDMLVTPDHNMYASPRTHEGWADSRLIPAREFSERSHRLSLTGGVWDGGGLHAPEDAELIGFIAADGHVGAGIAFHLKRDRKIAWLRSRASLTENGDKYYLQQPSKQLIQWARATYHDKDRCFPREILERGDRVTIQALLRGYLQGDGSRHHAGADIFSTVSQRLFDDIQEAALKTGQAVVQTSTDEKRSDAYGSRPLLKGTIYQDRNSFPRIGWTREDRQAQVQVVPYTGGVHCVTVPNGTLYVRRNGKPMWCGNSPFEHGGAIFFAHAPLFVFYEWHRHRIGFSFNEESGRYKELEPVFWVPGFERPMLKVEGYKPMRPTFDQLVPDDDGKLLYARMRHYSRIQCQDAYQAYRWELDHGVAPEVARRHLPVSIYKSMWVTCNPRSIMNFLSLRTHEPEAMFTSYPQLEIEDAARQIESVFAEHWPITYQAFCDFGRVGP